MRTLMKISLPVEPANKAIKDASLGKTIESLISELHAESAYFYAENGKRTAQLVFDLKDASQIPEVVEPLFVGLNATVELHPVMNAAELKTGLERAKKSLEKVLVASGYDPHGGS